MTRLFLLLACLCSFNQFLLANEPDSVYLFSYTSAKDNGRAGLHFAWSRDGKSWNLIGNDFGYVKSDYGRWGSEKQMNDPYVFQGANGQWHCIWSLNDRVNQLAHAASANLIDWGRQSYPYLAGSADFKRPVIRYDKAGQQYLITYESSGKYFQLTTKDFKTYSEPASVAASVFQDDRATVNLPGGSFRGTISRTSWKVADGLLKAYEARQYRSNFEKESLKDDSLRFADLEPVKVSITLQPENKKPISDLLVGVFFEDINYAADGGLYAELIQNRDFEYNPDDKEGNDKNWNSRHSWSAKGLAFTVDSASPVHKNNPHYAVLDMKETGGSLLNRGYDGIAVKKGEGYNLSLFARRSGAGKMLVKLLDKNGSELGRTTINISSGNWKKYRADIVATDDAKDANLVLQPLQKGSIMLDMISLFPKKTFKNRPNGMRADLAQTIAAIQPKFIRFPGGCVAHGDGLDNIYRWKNTIGALEARVPQRNLWGYHQSAGIGYYEYFQYCEDIGAQPLPVVAAGVPCQNSGTTAKGGGQQGGIPLSEMDAYVQDILDLIEWANGPATSTWGKLRAAAGHPKPFNLKYIGIGNEDLITDIFEERFTLINKAVQQKYPEIKVIGTVGPFWEGTDYEEGWQIAEKLKLPMVDEHYYQNTGWFINNQDFYDRYDRNKPKVYLGEYASWGNTLYNALAEAAYLTSIERNGDVVSMTSYAPLLAKEGHTQWNPDLIYFNNTDVKPTVNYEVQKLYGQNSGQVYLPSTVVRSNTSEAVKKRFSVSVVQDSASKDIIVKMVNLLPVATTAKLEMKGQVQPGSAAVRWTLGGNPAGKELRTVESKFLVPEGLQEVVPAYSFVTLRFKAK